MAINVNTFISGSAFVVSGNLSQGASMNISVPLTASMVSFTSASISGDLTIGGTITALEFKTTIVSASIIYQTGSTLFGNSPDDLHTFTGAGSFSGGVSTTSLTSSVVISAASFTSSLGLKTTGTASIVQSGGSSISSLWTDATDYNILPPTAGGLIVSAIPGAAVPAYLRLGLLKGSGAGSAAETGGLRMQGNGAAAGQINFRNLADNGDMSGMSLNASNQLHVGGAYPTRPTAVIINGNDYNQFYVGTALVATMLGNGTRFEVTRTWWGTAVVAPILTQDDSVTTNDLADDLTIGAQNINTTGVGTGYGGNAGIRGGIATNAGGATNKHGNVWFQAAPASRAYGGMEKGIFIANAVTDPTGSAPNGALLYVSTGSLTLYGSGSTASGAIWPAKLAVGSTIQLSGSTAITGSLMTSQLSEDLYVTMHAFG